MPIDGHPPISMMLMPWQLCISQVPQKLQTIPRKKIASHYVFLKICIVVTTKFKHLILRGIKIYAFVKIKNTLCGNKNNTRNFLQRTNTTHQHFSKEKPPIGGPGGSGRPRKTSRCWRWVATVSSAWSRASTGGLEGGGAWPEEEGS